MTVLFDATTVDLKTGEIVETRPNCPFRSATDDKAYEFKERNSGVSNVDPDSYVSIQEMEARCRRGDLVPQYRGSYDNGEIDDDHFEDFTQIETDELLEIQKEAEMEATLIAEELARRSNQKQESYSPTSPTSETAQTAKEAVERSEKATEDV